MRNKKAAAWGNIVGAIIAVLLIVLLILTYTPAFSRLRKATDCKGYCVASQADCITKTTADSDYCKKNAPGKPYCCVDLDYKGDPAGEHTSTEKNPHVIVTSADGTPILLNEPVTLVKEQPLSLVFGYDHKDAGDCVVTAMDNSVQPARPIGPRTKFNCKDKKEIGFNLGPEYVGRQNLNIDFIVLKKGAKDLSLSNWLASFKIPVVVAASTGPAITRNNIPLGPATYVGFNFEPVNILNYVDYSDHLKNTLTCSWELETKYSENKGVYDVKQDGCIFRISPQPNLYAGQYNTLKFTVKDPEGQALSFNAMFLVYYTPEKYCESMKDQNTCISKGCVYRNGNCILECMKDGRPCELGIYEKYCEHFSTQHACNNLEEGYCEWDLFTNKCAPIQG